MDFLSFVAWVRANGSPADASLVGSDSGRSSAVGVMALAKGQPLTPAHLTEAARFAQDSKIDGGALVDLLRVGELLLQFQAALAATSSDEGPPSSASPVRMPTPVPLDTSARRPTPLFVETVVPPRSVTPPPVPLRSATPISVPIPAPPPTPIPPPGAPPSTATPVPSLAPAPPPEVSAAAPAPRHGVGYGPVLIAALGIAAIIAFAILRCTAGR